MVYSAPCVQKDEIYVPPALSGLNGLQMSAYAYGGLAARMLGGMTSIIRPVAAVAKGGGYGLAIAGAATVGMVIGSGLNCR